MDRSGKHRFPVGNVTARNLFLGTTYLELVYGGVWGSTGELGSETRLRGHRTAEDGLPRHRR